jgi:hypothetical protein
VSADSAFELLRLLDSKPGLFARISKGWIT